MISHPTKLKLSHVQTLNQAIEVWLDHRVELDGYTFVLSTPNGKATLPIPSRQNFEGGGYLRSVFAHDNLNFVNEHLIREIANQGTAQIPVDYFIGFDSNVASFLRAWHRNRSVPSVAQLRLVLKSIRNGKLNWDVIPFLLERLSAILKQQDLSQIYETILASEWFASADRSHFDRTGEIRPTLTESELAIRAQVALADWDRMLKNGYDELVSFRFQSCYACVLKMVILHLESPGKVAGPKKLLNFLEFLDQELGAILLLFVRAAIELFANGSAFKPMQKVANASQCVFDNAKNVAWDFVLTIWRQEFAAHPGREGSFLVPYFLTFDRGLAELIDLYPQRSCLIGGAMEWPLFFQDIDFESLLWNAFPELSPMLSRVFTMEAATQRANRPKNKSSKLVEVVDNLERQLAALV